MREIIWLDVVGYEGLYQVNNIGGIKRLATPQGIGTGHYARLEYKIKSHKINTGYLLISLWKDNKPKQFLIHRIVANAFLPNFNNLPCINHKDENSLNNNVENLEWCTHKYNMNYGTRNKRIGEKNSKPVIQKNKNTGEIIRIFASAMEAERETGIINSTISEYCTSKRKTAGGFIWGRS